MALGNHLGPRLSSYRGVSVAQRTRAPPGVSVHQRFRRVPGTLTKVVGSQSLGVLSLCRQASCMSPGGRVWLCSNKRLKGARSNQGYKQTFRQERRVPCTLLLNDGGVGMAGLQGLSRTNVLTQKKRKESEMGTCSVDQGSKGMSFQQLSFITNCHGGNKT